MKHKDYEVVGFGKTLDGVQVPSSYVVDDRFLDIDRASYVFPTTGENIVTNKKTKVKFTPTCVVFVSEHHPADEAKEIAKMLCDRLNAAWVEDQLSGGT